MSPPSTSPTASGQTRCYIIDELSPEIRNMIYGHCITNIGIEKIRVSTEQPFREKTPRLFQTCSQIREESREMLLHDTTYHISTNFKLSASQKMWLATVGKKRAAKFGKVYVTIGEDVMASVIRMASRDAAMPSQLLSMFPQIHALSQQLTQQITQSLQQLAAIPGVASVQGTVPLQTAPGNALPPTINQGAVAVPAIPANGLPAANIQGTVPPPPNPATLQATAPPTNSTKALVSATNKRRVQRLVVQLLRAGFRANSIEFEPPRMKTISEESTNAAKELRKVLEEAVVEVTKLLEERGGDHTRVEAVLTRLIRSPWN